MSCIPKGQLYTVKLQNLFLIVNYQTFIHRKFLLSKTLNFIFFLIFPQKALPKTVKLKSSSFNIEKNKGAVGE